jgi:hypothetical protein
MTNLTTTQIGLVTEHALALALVIGSGGRLSPFMPLADDHGIDLIVADKETGRLLPIQVKSWTKDLQRSGTVQFDIRKKTIWDKSPALLVGLIFDMETASINQSWLMTMDDAIDLGNEYETKYALSPSARPNSNDRYRPFRHEDVASLVSGIQQYLADAEHISAAPGILEKLTSFIVEDLPDMEAISEILGINNYVDHAATLQNIVSKIRLFTEGTEHEEDQT